MRIPHEGRMGGSEDTVRERMRILCEGRKGKE